LSATTFLPRWSPKLDWSVERLACAEPNHVGEMMAQYKQATAA
jgi:hypothetical protein